jgi:hypothetical protein
MKCLGDFGQSFSSGGLSVDTKVTPMIKIPDTAKNEIRGYSYRALPDGSAEIYQYSETTNRRDPKLFIMSQPVIISKTFMDMSKARKIYIDQIFLQQRVDEHNAAVPAKTVVYYSAETAPVSTLPVVSPITAAKVSAPVSVSSIKPVLPKIEEKKGNTGLLMGVAAAGIAAIFLFKD